MPLSKGLLIVLTIIISLVGLFLGGYLYQTLSNLDLVSPNRIENKHYFSDEIFINGLGPNNEPLFIHLLLNRKQRASGDYLHYYTMEIVSPSLSRKIMQEQVSADATLIPLHGIKNITRQTEEDLSTRESYDITLDFGKEVTLKLSRFQGDFLLHNKFDHTKYASAGKALISLDGEEYELNALLTKTFAQNYSTYVFFDNFDQLDSTTHVVVAWDQNDQLYYLDTSDTRSKHTGYGSHKWGYFGSKLGGKKLSNITITHATTGKNPTEWQVSLPEIEDGARLEFKVNYHDLSRAAGLLKGKVKLGETETEISGYAIYAEY
jgi:hypothetical protein